jgi:hypothetical protein
MSAGGYSAAQAFLADSGVRREFADRTLARIEGQHEALGDSYLTASLDDLIRELREESEDSCAWGALLAARTAGGTSTGERARALLTAIAQRADEADALIHELGRLLAPEGVA